jgi:pimeloyl-ACP methyl ester carboxylesterase
LVEKKNLIFKINKLMNKNIIEKPSWFLHLTELSRAIVDYFRGFFFLQNTAKTNEGNGQTVLVIPGLMSTDIYTSPLRKLLTKIGYKAVGWELGRNYGRLEYLPKLQERAKILSNNGKNKIVVIGWSMGGILARELAKLSPEYFTNTITVGSPFANINAPNHAKWVYDILNKGVVIDPDFEKQIPNPPPMPTLAIYSKTDGMVPWEACMDIVPNELHKNQEIVSSHFGMGGSLQVMRVIRTYLAEK